MSVGGSSVDRGRLIVFEGGEGCGKSTQATRLAMRLDALSTREPGGTPAGTGIRSLLLDPGTRLDARAEALLMAADRAEHVATVIRPALEAGVDVVCDRYVGSSVAYQGGGRGLDPEEVRRISEWAVDGVWPDLVILLEVPPSVAAARLDRDLDRFEQEDEGFHARVAGSFAAQAAAEPQRWVRVDGTGDPEAVGRRVDAVVADRLGLTG